MAVSRLGPSARPRPGLRHAAASLLVMTMGIIAQSFGASCVVSDQFRCGVARADDGTLARICDQKGEYCICETQRCAVRDASCEKPGYSGFKYSFGSDECVSEEAAQTAIAQAAGGPVFCPGNGPDLPCGVAGGQACRADEVCVCDGHQCAVWDTKCESRYKYAGTGDCVAPEKAQPEAMVFTSDGGSGLCPGEEQLPPPCGMQLFGQAPIRCEGNQVCTCAQNLFRCAFLSGTCATGYRWAQDGSCVVAEGLTKEAIEAPEQQVNSEGVCPQFVP
jgi:hypothetical protein